MDWYKDWFDSKYYHILYRSRNVKEAQEFIAELNKRYTFNSSHRVLDLACGKGRHSVQLSSYGCQVDGLDLSASSIEYARQFESNNLRFDVHDMRAPLAKTYTHVLNLFTSFGYFNNSEDDLKVFNSVHKALIPNGILTIDFLNSNLIIQELTSEEVKTVDGIKFRISREVDQGKIIKTIEFSAEGKDWKFKEQVDKLTLDDFKKLAKKSGFRLVNVFGDYQLNEFNLLTSPRLIMEFQKI